MIGRYLIKYGIPVVALCGLVLAVFVVMQGSKAVPAAAPVAQPAPAPYASYVAGAGLVESATENIAIGTGVGGTVTEVFVHVGDKVHKGDPLFRVRDKTLRAELASQQAALRTSQATSMPVAVKTSARRRDRASAEESSRSSRGSLSPPRACCSISQALSSRRL